MVATALSASEASLLFFSRGVVKYDFTRRNNFVNNRQQ